MSEYKLDRDKDYKIEETKKGGKGEGGGDELEKGHNTNTKVKDKEEDDNNDNGRKKKKHVEEKEETPEPEIFRNLKTNLNNPTRKAQFLDEIVDYIGQYAERSMSQSEIDAYKRIVEKKLLKELTGLKKLDI